MTRDFKIVLCPIDFSESSYHAAEYAVKFAQQANGTLVLVHILHNPASEFFHEDGHVISWDKAKARAHALLQETKAKRLDNYAKTECVVDTGDPHDLVVKLARDRKTDLIVVATHGRTGLEHLVMGSVAEKVIRYAPCPVFVVREMVN
ncbi:MAG TPA: universal stress protein [Candidatus Kryptonia bacterium]|nr:universal stress protein [Candidatus Kryptonia bacterium]